ncbi:MAG: response regulator transcription factor [Candidatus Obscuribacterales bacterium]|jgi:DNA-binding response OmpR family regulator
MAKILLVEDDLGVAQLIEFTLESERYVIDHYTRVNDALAALKTAEYDLLILDWALPDNTGVELCKQYRSMGGSKPVLMLTARESSRDKVAGLNAGADDYVVKPFDPDELVARAKALLRRPPVIAGSILKVSSIEMDTSNFTVKLAGQSISLLPKEFAILQLLMEHPDRYFTAEAILARVWRSDLPVSTDSVRTQMKTLRKKLGGTDDGSVIENTRGLGYKIKTE